MRLKAPDSAKKSFSRKESSMNQTTQQCRDGIHAYTCWVKLILYTLLVVVLKKIVSFVMVLIVYPFRKLIAFRSGVEHDW